MKKLSVILLCTVFLFFSAGCSKKTSSKEKGLESMVTAVGFGKIDDKYSIHIEAVTVNSEEATETEKKVSLITGKGETLDAAFTDATTKNARTFMFSHCGVAVLSNDISPKYLRDIFRFLYKRKEINLSLRFVSTQNAELLLSCEPLSSVAVGYDIIDAINRQISFNGTNYKNKFYEIEALRKEPVNIFSVPDFKVEENNFSNNGISILKNDKTVMKLNNNDSVIYAFLTDNQKSGKILLNGSEIAIKKVNLKRDFSLDNGLTIILKFNFKITEGNFEKVQLKSDIESLFETSKKSGIDIFMMGNSIKKQDKKIWDEISHDYCNVYKNSKMVVEIK